MNIPGRLVKTVKELREYLDAVEATWSEMDKQYLGEFEQQALWVPYFTKEGAFKGFGFPYIDAPAFAAGNFVLDCPLEDLQSEPAPEQKPASQAVMDESKVHITKASP